MPFFGRGGRFSAKTLEILRLPMGFGAGFFSRRRAISRAFLGFRWFSPKNGPLGRKMAWRAAKKRGLAPTQNGHLRNAQILMGFAADCCFFRSIFFRFFENFQDFSDDWENVLKGNDGHWKHPWPLAVIVCGPSLALELEAYPQSSLLAVSRGYLGVP